MLEIFKTTDTGLKRIKKPVRGSWINIVIPTEEDERFLYSHTKIKKEDIESLLDIDEIPSVEKYGEDYFILIKTPQKDGGELEYSTVPLGIYLSDKYFITICFWENDCIRRLKKTDFSTGKRIRTTLKLLYISSKLYLEYLKEIQKKIYVIQKDLEKSMRNEEMIHLLNLEKSLIYFTTSLRSNYILIEKLTKNRLFTRYKEDNELLEDVLEETIQAIDMANIYSNILSGMMDAFASIISNNLNMVMKLLASITIILMIPTLIASIYGMNISLPFQTSPHAFLLIISLSILFSIIGVIIFWKARLF